MAWAGESNIGLLAPSLARSWPVAQATRSVLTDIGLPRYGDLFIPDLQRDVAPALPPYYLLGHDLDHDLPQAKFGLRATDGSIWQLFTDDRIPPLFVNSSMMQLVYFLHALGAAEYRYRGLSDAVIIRRSNQVMRRLPKWDEGVVADTFWGYIFDRPWG